MGRIVKLYSKRGVYFMSVFFQGTADVGRQHLVVEVPAETFSSLRIDDEVRLVVSSPTQDGPPIPVGPPAGPARRTLELHQ